MMRQRPQGVQGAQHDSMQTGQSRHPRKRRSPASGDASHWQITAENLAGIEHPASNGSELSYNQHAHYQQKGSFDDWTEDTRLSIFEMPRLEEYHIRFRSPHQVSDNRYHEHLSRQNPALMIPGRKRSRPMCTQACGLHFCAGFSAVATAFLLWVGLILDYQPLYIKGALPLVDATTGYNSRHRTYMLSFESRLPAASTAYRSALAYLIVMALCLYALHPRRRRLYEAIPDSLPLANGSNTSWLRIRINECLRRVSHFVQQRSRRSHGYRRKNTPKTI